MEHFVVANIVTHLVHRACGGLVVELRYLPCWGIFPDIVSNAVSVHGFPCLLMRSSSSDGPLVSIGIGNSYSSHISFSIPSISSALFAKLPLSGIHPNSDIKVVSFDNTSVRYLRSFNGVIPSLNISALTM